MNRLEGNRGGPLILVIQHSDKAPGGIFSNTLAALGAELSILYPLRGEVLPEEIGPYDGLVVLGGPQHAADDSQGPHFPELLTLLRSFDREDRPVAGICLGCQLLARAHGGEIARLDRLEFGFVELRRTAAGDADPVLRLMPPPPLMEFHEDSFLLPEGAHLLVTGAQCRNQSFRVGRYSYGFQFHLEVDEVVAKQWLEMFKTGDLGSYGRHSGQFDSHFIEELSQQLPQKLTASVAYGTTIAKGWLDLVIGCKAERRGNN